MWKRHSEMAPNRLLRRHNRPGFWPDTKVSENISRRPVCPRFHINQQTISLQIRALREYAVRRGGAIALQVKEAGSGAVQGQLREKLLDAIGSLGPSVADLVSTLQELTHLSVGFVSLTEALDLTTPSGRAMAVLLALFAEFEREILRERVLPPLCFRPKGAKAASCRRRQSRNRARLARGPHLRSPDFSLTCFQQRRPFRSLFKGLRCPSQVL